LEESITTLIKKNEHLENKFNKVSNFFVRVMHSTVTTLHLLQASKEGTTDKKDTKTTKSQYGFLVDDQNKES